MEENRRWKFDEEEWKDKFNKAIDKALEKWRLSWTESSIEHQTTATNKWNAEVEACMVRSVSARNLEFSKEEVHDVDIVCQKASAVKVFDESPKRDLEENAYDFVNSVETRKGDMIGERGNRPGLAPFQLHTPTGTHPEFSSYITPHFNCYDECGKFTDVGGYGEVGTDFWGSYKDGGSGGGPGQGRVRTLDIPRFEGNNSDGWIRRVEQLLYVYRVSESELLKVIEMAFSGDVLRWYQWENNRRPFRCWTDLKGVILRQYHSSTYRNFNGSYGGYGGYGGRSEFRVGGVHSNEHRDKFGVNKTGNWQYSQPDSQYQEGQVNGAEAVSSANGQDMISTEYWESLYPGWKYDQNTGQWYQVDGGDTTTSVAGNLNTAVHNEATEVSYLQQTSQSSLGLHTANKVPKQKKLFNTPSLGFGALASPGREISIGPQIIQRDPHRCQNCGAYANFYCNILIGSGQWQCVICRNLNGSEGEYIASSKEELRSLPELSSPFVDYIQTGNKRPGFVPVSDSRMSASVVLVIDECLDEPHLQHLQSSLHAFVDSLPPTTRIGIVLYGRTVSVYDFSEESTASADVLPGRISPSQESLKALIYGTGLYLSPVHASGPVAHSIFSSLRPYKLNLPEASRDRCLGTAVEVALAIIQGPSAELPRGVMKRSGGDSRIIVCAGGPNTHGPGSVPHSLGHPNYPYMEKAALKWMEHLGREAHRRNTVVDILCAGTCPVRVPILQPLAKASGGVLILHDDFGEAFGVNLQRASTRAAGSHGLFEVRCSDNIFITQVIGPGEEANADNHESFKNDNSLSIQMLSVEEMQCFALSMETKSDIKSDYVYFQFSIQYSNVYHADISRVITVRLPTVDSVSAYLESVQDEVASVIIAKRTLLRAKSSSTANDMRATIDERIKDISNKFGSQMPKSKLYRFPKELSLLPELLFHLRRGPLLGSIIGHEDERSVLRNLFLNVSLDLSIRMVAPRCLMHREGGTFEELPAHDLAMQSDSAVVLDHGTDVFIWLGAELASEAGKSAAALAACRTLAEELTEMRFPAPRILAFKEGSSQARYFVSRLIPAHKDPPYEQEARFPQLRTLSAEQRTKLKSSFIHFDDPSFCEWMRSLKVSPPEPS